MCVIQYVESLPIDKRIAISNKLEKNAKVKLSKGFSATVDDGFVYVFGPRSKEKIKMTWDTFTHLFLCGFALHKDQL